MPEAEDTDRQLAEVRAAYAAFGSASGTGPNPKDLLKFLEHQSKVAIERADREERMAKLQADAAERKERREAQERKETHLRVAAYRFSILLVAVLVASFYFADTDQRKTIITLALTTLFGLASAAGGFYFGGKDKVRKDD